MSAYISKSHVYCATGSEFPASIFAAGGCLHKLKHALKVYRVRVVQGGHVLGYEVDLHIATCRSILHG